LKRGELCIDFISFLFAFRKTWLALSFLDPFDEFFLDLFDLFFNLLEVFITKSIIAQVKRLSHVELNYVEWFFPGFWDPSKFCNCVIICIELLLELILLDIQRNSFNNN
jgi:fucose 4-O-acetylase-like acetyltransferase